MSYQLKKSLATITGIALLGLLFSTSAMAQQRKPMNLPNFDHVTYHFGFILGVNQMLFSVKTVDNLSFMVLIRFLHRVLVSGSLGTCT